jgi:hypothetical protein
VAEGFFAPRSIARLLADYPQPWAFAGGWAIDLWLDRETRSHKDVDVAVLRRDQTEVRRYLVDRGWTVEKAVGRELSPWEAGETLELPIHVVWCRNPAHDPDFLELVLNEAAESTFLFRRDSSLVLPLDRAFQRSPSGLPILAPEIALLYKAKYPDLLENGGDLLVALPALSPGSRRWLRASLARIHPGHAWLDAL